MKKHAKDTLLKLGFVATVLLIIAVTYFGFNLNSLKGDRFVGHTYINNNADLSLPKDFHLKLESVLMPYSRGYGDLYSWQAAMTLDPNLLKMAEDIFSTEPKDYHLLKDKFEKFLFRWAKVEDATSEEVYNHVNRGVSYDPRKIAFLERITGLNFINANKESVAKAKESWEEFYNTFLNRFLTQATMNKIFPRTNYDFKNDALHINSTLDEVIANAKLQAPKQGLATYYAYVVNIIKLNKSEFNDPDFDKKIEEILIYSK